MPLLRKPTRYAHPEGHTDVCYYDGEKGGFITCGSDGDVRSWLSLVDDDPAASCIAEQSIAVISKNGKIYVANDNNTIQILSYPDLEKEGILTRFSAPVSALSTTTNSKFIVSGACDMRIQVTNVDTSDTIELEGHEAPILGLSLDPKEEFVASSSADGTIKIWSISDKQVVTTINNVIPKCNSFFTAKLYGSPSFQSKDGSYLAYPCNKDVIVLDRNLWKESFRLKCSSLKADLNICKYSQCGTKLAAVSVHGEVVVWNAETKELIGYIDHHQNVKITSIAWSLDKSDNIAFCDALGQLGCIEVVELEKSLDECTVPVGNSNDEANAFIEDKINDDEDDDDGENVISLDKIKASMELDDDQKSNSSIGTGKQSNLKNYMPEINLQPPFQPGSSPDHLLSRFMAWNDTGMVRCFNSEDGEESNIEVEFHDITIHHSMHINNYLGHKIAALSPNALALSCPSSDDTPSKLVVVALQGWGSGNKEWSLEFPEGEEVLCLAAGSNFVAVATNSRNLRIYMTGGTQREILAIPGPVVAMNALGNSLIVAYHCGVGLSNDQNMKLLWIKIRGLNLRCQTLSLPLSPSSNLMWLGLTELGSPTILDDNDILKIYNKKLDLWRVVSDMNKQVKGKMDHYFIIGISEEQRLVRCVLCKGSYYPPTTPKPIISEIPLNPPFCEPGTDKTAKEIKLWQIGSNETDKNEAVLALIALACRRQAEYCAVELCEEIASQKVIDLAIVYARKINRLTLADKLESIADIKEQQAEKNSEEIEENILQNGDDITNNDENEDNEEEILTPSFDRRKSDIEIKPLSLSDTMSIKRNNPFVKSGKSPSTKGLEGLSTAPEKPLKLAATMTKPVSVKSKLKNTRPKQSFVSWYSKEKKSLQEEFPDLSSTELTKQALQRYKEEIATQNSENDETLEGKKRNATQNSENDETLEGKKRKATSELKPTENQPKRAFSTALSAFSFEK